MKKIYILMLLMGFPMALMAQIEGLTQRQFGKNRVQYRKFEWRLKTSPNFEVYSYDYGSGISDYAILYAESEFNRIADLLGHNPDTKTRLFIYNSITDLQQSNVGLENENKRTVGGQTNFVKPKIEIPFTGSLYDFKREISYGIAQIFVNEMMYGGSIREILKNGALLTLPDWFMPGVAAYASEGWGYEMDDYMRNFIKKRPVRKPHRLLGDEAQMVGQSIWNYIAIKYGQGNVSSILNLTRVVQNEQNAISSTLGIPYENFIDEWKDYYLEMSKRAEQTYDPLEYDKKLKKYNPRNKKFNEIKISPDGRFIAYSENLNGRYKVFVRDLERNKKHRVFKTGFKFTNQRINERMPLLAWTDDNKLAICFAKRGRTQVRIQQVSRRNKRRAIYKKQLEYFNQVTAFDISADGSRLLFSSDRIGSSEVWAGMNDLYTYDMIGQTQTRLTYDLYDETDASFVGRSSENIVFSSNRPNDTIRINPGNFKTIKDDYNVFLYKPSVSKVAFERLTNDAGMEKFTSYLDENTILYTSNENGINNLYAVDIATKEKRQLTNSIVGIKKYSANAKKGLLAFRTWEKRKEVVVLKRNFDFKTDKKTIQTERVEYLKANGLWLEKVEEKKPVVDTSKKVDIITKPYNPNIIDTDDYEFDPEVIKELQTSLEKAQADIENKKQNKKSDKIEIRGAFPYEPLFTTESSVSTLLADPLRGTGILLEVELSDLLENHKIRGGVFGLTNLKSASYYLEYQYLAKRIDLSVRYERKSYYAANASTNFYQRYALNKFLLTAAYPFTNASRLSLTAGYMDNKFTDMSIPTGLPKSDLLTGYVHTKLEYVFDNTVPLGINMIRGTRAKIFFENNISQFFDYKGKSFNNLFFDIRHYQPISRELIFATRVSGGSFGGGAAKSYVLGGVDNKLFSSQGNPYDDTRSFNPLDIPSGGNPDILFHEFATNLRGYDYNRQSGNKFILFNAELRLPLFKYLFRNAISSNFFKNLQFAAFGDLGAAWNKNAPWSKESDANNFVKDALTYEIKYRTYQNPWLASYGVGARTLLFGYYLKLDLAWTVEDYISATKPLYYVSFGYDF